jgi:hypothetical protein
MPDGSWVAIRVVGPSSKYVSDSYAFAQTSPVYVARGSRRWMSLDEGKFLAQVVDAIWARVDGPRAVRIPTERDGRTMNEERTRSARLRDATIAILSDLDYDNRLHVVDAAANGTAACCQS